MTKHTDWLSVVQRMISLDPGFTASQEGGVITISARRASPVRDGYEERLSYCLLTRVLNAAVEPETIVRDTVNKLRVAMGGRPA